MSGKVSLSASPYKTGYLDVKIPPKSRTLRNFKAWRKRWVVISSTEVNKVEPPSLIIQIFSNEFSAHKERGCLFWKVLSSEQSECTNIYRSRSRTHKHAFSIAKEYEVILHLAGNSETQSQEWMATMRDILWPPNPLHQLKKVRQGSHDVSLIDSESTCHINLLGAYGYLTVRKNKLIFSKYQGNIIKEWQLHTIKRYQLVPQMCREDLYKVFSMLIVGDSCGYSGQFQFFGVNTLALLQTLNHALDQCGPVESLLDMPIDHMDLIHFDEEETCKQNPILTTDDELDDNRHSTNSAGSTSTDSSDCSLPNRLLSLPDHLLNCSINSTQTVHEDPDSDSYTPPQSPLFEDNLNNSDYDSPTAFPFPSTDKSEEFETSHIYDNIPSNPPSKRPSRNDSIYEDLEQYLTKSDNISESEFSPPLPPRNLHSLSSHLIQFDKSETSNARLKNSKLSKLFNRKLKYNQNSSLEEKSDSETAYNESITRTRSVPIFYQSLSPLHSPKHILSKSAPNQFN